MSWLKTARIGPKRSAALAELTACCNRHDKCSYGVPDDADLACLCFGEDGRLCAAAALYAMGDRIRGLEIIEAAAFTAPQYRRKGYFREALARLQPQLAGKAVRFAVYGVPDTLAVLRRIGAVHDHDELMLELELRSREGCGSSPLRSTYSSLLLQGDGAQKKVLSDAAGEEILIDRADGKASSAYSECYFRVSGDSAYIYGVMTYLNHRGKGHGERLLRALIGELSADGITRFLLQVSAENRAALSLYEKLGMHEIQRLSYWYLFGQNSPTCREDRGMVK